MIRRVASFKYTLPYRKGRGFCTLNVLRERGGRVAVFLQAKNYKDFQSPTNCIEYVAAQICERLKIDPKKLALYEGPDPSFKKDRHPDPWQRVTFKGKKGVHPDANLGNPSWEPLTVRDWARLFESASGAKFA